MKFSRIILIINPLLLGYFFIIFLYSSNLGEGIRLTEFFSLFFLVSIFSFLIFFPCLLILKKLEKASFLSIILLFIFYSYGLIPSVLMGHDQLPTDLYVIPSYLHITFVHYCTYEYVAGDNFE